MIRTDNSVRMLKAIAMIAGLAILLWSLGLPSLRFIEAANITSVSDILSDSAPSASADHEISFTIPSTGPGVANGETIVINFTGFDSTGVDSTDIDLSGSTFGAMTVAADCAATDNASAAFSGSTLTITLCSGDSGVFVNDEVVTLLIGQNATGGAANAQLTNPGAEGSYEIDFTSVGAEDSGSTRVVILTAVTVTATVDTIFTFSVAGTAAGTEMFPGGATTTGSSASTSIAFGTLTANQATTSAQLLTVETNAANGYVVTVQVDGELRSSTGEQIYTHNGGANTTDPWVSPTNPVVGTPSTYGFWGITSDDEEIPSRSLDEFDTDGLYIAATSTEARDVMAHTGPTVSTSGRGVGTTTVGYKVEISALQAAGDYSTTLTYVATPTF